MQFAIALYNNEVDDEDELEFRKGDVLTVLIENPNGLNGWWLCQHKGKCGLCPGNRLKLISTAASASNEPQRSSPCLSTASMYDSLSNDYDIPITAAAAVVEHDYDIPQGSDFIPNASTPTPIDSSPETSTRSSPETSTRSSGIYSTNDLRLSDLSTSSSSSEFHTSSLNGNTHSHFLSSIDIDQLQVAFRKLSIRSSLLDKYRQLLSSSTFDSTTRLFIHECRLFLYDYGCLLDRPTYKIFKQNLLYELEQLTNSTHQRTIQLATQILQLIKPIIELRAKQKNGSGPSIPIDVFKKLNLEPIEELTNENENKKLPTSMSTTQIYGSFQPHKSKAHARSSQLTTSRTCHSNFLTELSNKENKSDHYDYIDDDYSTPMTDPLVKCYHRHIREHVASMSMRHSRLSQLSSKANEANTTTLLIAESKALIVAGHKLVFVLETLHEHLGHAAKVQTPLISLTRQLRDSLTSFVRLLKQFSNQACTNTQQFEHDTQTMMNLVKKIQQQCSSV